MDLRAGSPASERRTWSRSLRGPILAGPASSCAHDHDCLRLPPVLSAQNSETGKKESAGHRLNRHCRPYAEPSSNSSLGYHRNDAHTAENGFAASSGMSESAKVVLGRILINRPVVFAFGRTGHWSRHGRRAAFDRCCCDGHHKMSDLGAVCGGGHSGGERVAPVWPHQRTDGPPAGDTYGVETMSLF